jgi:hypothetical protein
MEIYGFQKRSFFCFAYLMWFSFHLRLFQPFSFEIRKTATIRIVWLHTGQQWVDPPKDQLLYTTSFRRTVEVIQAPMQTRSGGFVPGFKAAGCKLTTHCHYCRG